MTNGALPDFGFGLAEYTDGTFGVFISLRERPFLISATVYTDRADALADMAQVADATGRLLFLMGYPGHLGDVKQDGI